MEVVGVPFDLGGQVPGSRLGPAALRIAGLKTALEMLHIEVHDEGDIQVLENQPYDMNGLRHFDAAMDCYVKTKARVLSALQKNRIPLVIGGDHSIAIGALSGGLEHFGSDLSVLWIDAHADINTPATSPSGNLHGMAVSPLLGFPSGTTGLKDEQWNRILNELVPETRLQAQRTAWVGLRDVDQGEIKHLNMIPKEFAATMYDIDRRGIVEVVHNFHNWMKASGSKSLWISFDVDALDPILAPGTGTAVRGGLTYREMHLLGELLCELLTSGDGSYRLVGIELVETNPLTDTNNITAKMAIEFITSLFGKTILGTRK